MQKATGSNNFDAKLGLGIVFLFGNNTGFEVARGLGKARFGVL
jgi:hypothetical protein